MPPMKLCPNRKNHPSHKRIDSLNSEIANQEYKVISHRGMRHRYYLDEDKMIRLYTNHKDRYVRLPYWYCKICSCVVHETFIEPNYMDENTIKQIVFLPKPTLLTR